VEKYSSSNFRAVLSENQKCQLIALAISVREQHVKFHTVLAIAFVDKINCKQLWIAFGTGQHFRYISIHELASALGPQHSCALPAFHIHYSVSICWTWKKVMLGDVEEMSRSH